MFSFFKSQNSKNIQPQMLRNIVAEGIETSGLNNDVRIDDIKLSEKGQVIIALFAANLAKATAIESLRGELQKKIMKLNGVTKVLVVVATDQKAPPVPAALPKNMIDMNGIDVIAVTSGKGGVGKSTLAVNLAVALSRLGRKVGILDADIYGPSLPRLLGIPAAKAVQGEDGRLLPIEVYGIKAMSMGFMVDEAAPMIWRGPMVQSALIQMLRDVAWDGIDMLVIDMPPGTGDIHLTLAQRVTLAGGVVVSTPQDIALIDARKGLEMFRKVSVPILGIVENMSYFACPSCGHRSDIFGHGGARLEAIKMGVPFLGEIPLHIRIRELSDAGTPVTLSVTESEQAQSFMTVAKNVMSGLEQGTEQTKRPAPRMIMED